MEAPSNGTHEAWITVIEAQDVIAERYSRIKRLTDSGGQGQFSLMFRAFDEVEREEVAVKFLDPGWMHDPYRTECFSREVKILEMFRGRSNILQLVDGMGTLTIDVTTPQGRTVPFPLRFFVSELACQGSLRDYIYSSSTNPLESLMFFREMCKAVQRIHAGKVCHRDLKPGNFLVFRSDRPGNRVKLSDFGTARSFDRNAESLLRRYPGPPGDYLYTSPELLCGLGREQGFTFFNDHYSLGAILFEMFTKTYLNLVIFNSPRIIEDLVACFNATQERDRRRIFHDTIGDVARSRPLPDIFAYNQTVPRCVKNQLNGLYKSLASLDYRTRLTEFSSIFRQIGICTTILANELKYRKWRELRKKFREATLQHRWGSRC